MSVVAFLAAALVSTLAIRSSLNAENKIEASSTGIDNFVYWGMETGRGVGGTRVAFEVLFVCPQSILFITKRKM